MFHRHLWSTPSENDIPLTMFHRQLNSHQLLNTELDRVFYGFGCGWWAVQSLIGEHTFIKPDAKRADF